MGLSFLDIKDERGCAIYFIHDGSDIDTNRFERLLEDVKRRTKKQCVLFSVDQEDARELIDFYDLRGSHFVVIVRDDDQLHHVWSDGELFDASRIAYTAEQAG